MNHVRDALDGAEYPGIGTAMRWIPAPTTPCPTTSYGPQALPCRRQADHDGGHAWIGSDVPDRHDEGVTDE